MGNDMSVTEIRTELGMSGRLKISVRQVQRLKKGF